MFDADKPYDNKLKDGTVLRKCKIIREFLRIAFGNPYFGNGKGVYVDTEFIKGLEVDLSHISKFKIHGDKKWIKVI